MMPKAVFLINEAGQEILVNTAHIVAVVPQPARSSKAGFFEVVLSVGETIVIDEKVAASLKRVLTEL